jgi:hypothetical protein
MSSASALAWDSIQGFNRCHEKWMSILQLHQELQDID